MYHQHMHMNVKDEAAVRSTKSGGRACGAESAPRGWGSAGGLGGGPGRAAAAGSLRGAHVDRPGANRHAVPAANALRDRSE